MPSKILANIHQSIKGLHDAGIVDAVTMHKFDRLCLPIVHKLDAKEIKKLRLREKVSQPVFAEYLNVSSSAVKQWESGEKIPSGAALRLLNLIEQKGLKIIN